MDEQVKKYLKFLPWPWYVILVIALAIGVLLLFCSCPFWLSGMLHQVRPDGWWQLLGIFMISGVVSHISIYFTLILLGMLFKLDVSKSSSENLWPQTFMGLCESVLYPSALIIGHADFIGLWLLLKSASNWPRWGTKGEGTDELNEGRRRYTRFLIGNGMMLFMSVITYGFIKAYVFLPH